MIFNVLLMAIPLYVANASAMLVGGGRALDFGATFNGQPLLGKGKTWRGTLGGFFLGALAAYILLLLAPGFTSQFSSNYALLGVSLSAGAILGDLVASFIKRRLGMEPGQQSLLLDQLDFVAGGLLLSLWAYVPTLIEVAVLVVLTLIAHRASNWLAFKLKIKKVPW